MQEHFELIFRSVFQIAGKLWLSPASSKPTQICTAWLSGWKGHPQRKDTALRVFVPLWLVHSPVQSRVCLICTIRATQRWLCKSECVWSLLIIRCIGQVTFTNLWVFIGHKIPARKGCSVVRGLLGRDPPDLTLESTSPSPPQASVWHRFIIDASSIPHRIPDLTLVREGGVRVVCA